MISVFCLLSAATLFAAGQSAHAAAVTVDFDGLARSRRVGAASPLPLATAAELVRI